jgi:hypothetical protein
MTGKNRFITCIATVIRIEKIGKIASKTMTFSVYGNIAMQIFMSAFLSLLWGLMNTMQIIIHL